MESLDKELEDEFFKNHGECSGKEATSQKNLAAVSSFAIQQENIAFVEDLNSPDAYKTEFALSFSD